MKKQEPPVIDITAPDASDSEEVKKLKESVITMRLRAELSEQTTRLNSSVLQDNLNRKNIASIEALDKRISELEAREKKLNKREQEIDGQLEAIDRRERDAGTLNAKLLEREKQLRETLAQVDELMTKDVNLKTRQLWREYRETEPN